ncbi:phage tail assembly chaperone [Immundisolibacter sp.]
MNQTQSFKEYEIDEQVYSISLFAADQGLKVCAKLIKLIGEPMLQLSGAEKAKTSEERIEILKSALGTLVSRLDEDQVVSLCKTLCSVVTLANSSKTLDKEFNLYFRGKYGHLFKLLVKVVEYNFEDFLGELGQGAGLAPQKNQ